MQAKESIELVEKPVILRELLKTQRPALVNAALETLFTSSWSSKIEIEEIVCSKILNGIFKNIEKDLAQDRPKKQDFHLTRYYLRAFQRDKDLRQKDQQLIDELKLVKNDLQKQLNVTYQMVKESPVGAVDCDSQLQVVHW